MTKKRYFSQMSSHKKISFTSHKVLVNPCWWNQRILLFSQFDLLENYWVHWVIDHCNSDSRFILFIDGSQSQWNRMHCHRAMQTQTLPKSWAQVALETKRTDMKADTWSFGNLPCLNIESVQRSLQHDS